MATALSPAETTADVGRLPSVPAPVPIRAEDFERLARTWATNGVWLTYWNGQARCIGAAANATGFWNMLWTKSEPFAQAMASTAQAAIRQFETAGGPAAVASTFGLPIGAMVAPVRVRGRIAGVVIGLYLSAADFSEEMVRLCDQSGLDVAAMKALAGALKLLPAEAVEATQELLRLTVHQASQNGTSQDEITALAQNLETTYEELHLLYKISGHMTFTNGPLRVLDMVARELTNVCRAAGIAFVLTESEAPFGRNANLESGLPSLSERIIQVGQGSPQLADLDALAESIQLSAESEVGHFLFNNAGRRPELEWASGWLKHLVVLPLWWERRLLGVMLAMNCVDGGDFTSVDVQLFRAIADRVAPFLENHRLYQDLADLLMGMLHALVSSIDAKDAYTCGHSERVAYIARALAHAAGLPDATCERIYLSGLLHDVGKIGVPDNVLCKPGKLTEEEFAAMRRHPEIGAKILSRVRQVQDLLPGVLHHHERMDGRGYPAGLAGEEIPLFGRLICIADCFDAMTTNRTYRNALPLPVAVAEVRRCLGTQFDPQLAEVFLKLDHEKLLQEARAISSTEDALAIGREITSNNLQGRG